MSIKRLVLASVAFICVAANIIAEPIRWVGYHVAAFSVRWLRLAVDPPTIIGRHWIEAPRSTDPNGHQSTSRSAFVDQARRAGFSDSGPRGRTTGVWRLAAA